MSLNAEQRRALELFAAGPRGRTKTELLADGFTAAMLADSVTRRKVSYTENSDAGGR